MRSKYCIKYRIRQIPGWKIFDILLSQTTNIFLRDLFMCGKESMFSYQRSNLLMLTPEFLSENTLFFPTLILLLFMWKRCFLNGHGMQAFQIKLHFVLARETGRIRRRRVMKSNHRWFRYFCWATRRDACYYNLFRILWKLTWRYRDCSWGHMSVYMTVNKKKSIQK